VSKCPNIIMHMLKQDHQNLHLLRREYFQGLQWHVYKPQFYGCKECTDCASNSFQLRTKQRHGTAFLAQKQILYGYKWFSLQSMVWSFLNIYSLLNLRAVIPRLILLFNSRHGNMVVLAAVGTGIRYNLDIWRWLYWWLQTRQDGEIGDCRYWKKVISAIIYTSKVIFATAGTRIRRYLRISSLKGVI
jgi:hypothetical protein